MSDIDRDAILETLLRGVSVKYDAVCISVFVIVIGDVIVCVNVLTSVDVDVDELLPEDVRVTRILFEIIDETEGEVDDVLVLDVDIDPLDVDTDVPVFVFVVVLVTVLEVDDVFELKLDLESKDDAVELLDILLDNVSLAELVRIDEYV